ncbi:UvrD-helicase domain-containing protein [Pacificibacter sp. AS14]|uniref:UvrD-helicase domain-containing protein n=1 Tax=Pacificibacter sp. AS14 TaxID=3135785 RepID=UPI00317EAE3D
MKYVCIDDGAVAEMISGRVFQSIDFQEGAELLAALSTNVEMLAKIGNMICSQTKDTLFLSTVGSWKSKKFLIIDCEQSALFSTLKRAETLTSFQKLLRFCTRFWSGSGQFTRSEHIVRDSTKAILFPLPDSKSAFGSSFRILLETEPDKVRMVKRDCDGKFLFAYNTCEHAPRDKEYEVNYTNFKKAFDAIPELYAKIQSNVQKISTAQKRPPLAETKVPSTNAIHSVRSHLPFSAWIPLLTSPQKAFVMSDHRQPHRLIGPAGSGKTLSLLLKSIATLKRLEAKQEDCRALIVTHSEATRKAILETLSILDEEGFHSRSPLSDAISLSVETLASLCAEVLKTDIKEYEFVDRDAQDSKEMQLLYIEEAISSVKQLDFPSFKPFLSEAFLSFFQNDKIESLAPLFQHEISVLIKGRADDSFDAYKLLDPLAYGLPVENDADKGLVFKIFSNYQSQLEVAEKFDTDDVVLSAVGNLHTPIWRRRRAKTGYDFIAIDETHLFNINELHIFHHFTRSIEKYPFSFSVDQAQGVGDRGWNEADTFSQLFDASDVMDTTNRSSTVFRSSPDILSFCGTVLASGANLFTSFRDTLVETQSAFTEEDERRSLRLKYSEYPDDQTMIEAAFLTVERLAKDTGSKPWEVLITTLSDSLQKEMEAFAISKNKAVTVIKNRGDYTRVRDAEKSGHFVLGHADFVGGLEFNVVVAVGIDKGRVPLEETATSNASTNFYKYSAHNRLYVAASRAKYALEFLGVDARGPSELLQAALHSKLIDSV